MTNLKRNNHLSSRVSRLASLVSHLSSSEGFTLIELVIVFTIIIILSSVGLASFSSYSKQQALQTAAFDVETMINVAKSRTLSQVKPGDCSGLTLEGYEIIFNKSTGQYNLQVLCGGTFFPVPSAKTLPNGIYFDASTVDSITFTVFGASPSTGGQVIVKENGLATTKTITVSTLGSITLE